MSRQQTVRSRARQPIRPSQDTFKSGIPAKLSRQSPLQFIFLLLQGYIPLLWLAAFAILIGSTTAAVISIMDPDASVKYSNQQHPALASVDSQLPSPQTDLPADLPEPSTQQLPVIQPSPASASNAEAEAQVNSSQAQTASKQAFKPRQAADSASPFSAGGAILLSCAAGCFLLSQWLKPDSAVKAAKTRRLRSKKLPQARSQASNLPQTIPQPQPMTPAPSKAELLLPPLQPVAQPSFTLSEPLSSTRQSEQTHQSKAAEIKATVLPAHQSHPLDWDEPSLADSLDLRQRRPLSYWL